MSNKTYDTIKFITIRVMPAIVTFWLTIAFIWNIPYGEPIGATIGAIETLLGTIIGVSNNKYKKGNNINE